MEYFNLFYYIFLVFISGLSRNSIAGVLKTDKCPINCICYPNILSNLASWEWIESDIHTNPDDPDNNEFNPYTEHNEVYDNPKTSNSLKSKEIFETVTCIIRNDSSWALLNIFNQIPSKTQVLSVLQAVGSGNITIGKTHFNKLTQLIGIDIQGYKDKESEFKYQPSSFRLEPDAFLGLKKLKYLSLDNVLLQQTRINYPTVEFTSKIVTIRKTGVPSTNMSEEGESGEVVSDLESQLIFLSPKKSKSILPYSVYRSGVKTEKRNNEPKEKPPEPKVAVAFTDIPSLLHLRISECNMEEISWDMFNRLNSLKFLLLERNNLLFLPDFLFYATSNLTTLSLLGNRILSLETVGLAGLLYLQKLDVTHNNITHLSELSLPPFPHLEVADFRYNPIETIFPNTFEVMNSTKTLYLGNPSIPLEIFPNSFYGLTSLLNLDITNIRIDFLERPMLKGLHNLKSLVMNGKIRKISYDAFSEIPNVEKLILRKCNIEKISMDAFFGLSSLLELDLSHNRLTFIPPGIFDDQASLREIYLQYNQLTNLPQNLFLQTPIKLIRLEKNPWHCSCDMISWNPSKINQVKSYFIPKRNDTFCQRKYDKGSMCRQDDGIGLQVKYIYEKRVTPICETPNKFNGKTVFDVMRKELKYCNGTIKDVKSKIKLIKPINNFWKKEKTATLYGTKLEKLKKPMKNLINQTTTATTTVQSLISKQIDTTTIKLSEKNNDKTTEIPNEEQSIVDSSITVKPENNFSQNLTQPLGFIKSYFTDERIVNNEIGNYVTESPVTEPVEVNTLPTTSKPVKSKYNTPRPLKTMRRNTLKRPKVISSKAMKLAKLYATENENPNKEIQ